LALIPDHRVKERYQVNAITIWRWTRDPKLAFPQPIRIRGRNYRCEAELDEFDQRRMAEREDK
jgi:predicted DNA-binding transcriptional regulator AlpA